MKKLSALLVFLLVLGLPEASARRFRIGIRGGINLSHYRFDRLQIGDTWFVPGNARAGYEAGAVLRVDLSRRFHLQGELGYALVNYDVLAINTDRRIVRLRTGRLEMPVQAGLQFGPLRFFGGPLFRLCHSDRSSAAEILRIGFNNRNIGLMGGIGLNIRRFFIDFRVSGYPQSHVWQTFFCGTSVHRVKVPHDIVYGGSIGFFF